MTRRSSLRWSLGLAVLMSLALVTDGLALTWSTGVKVTSATTANIIDGALGGGSTTLHLVHRKDVSGQRIVVYRRSSNDGVSWSPDVELSRVSATYSNLATLSVSGATIDAVWVEGDPNIGATRMYYRRSTNSGTDWTTAAAVSSTATDLVGVPAIARKGSIVVLAYTDWDTGKVYLRRSIDGGAHWLARVALGSSTLSTGSGGLLDGFPSIAFGDGVVYIVWMGSSTTVSMRRSIDGGASWMPAVSLETKAYANATVAAQGSSAMVTYGYFDGATNSTSKVRRTSDKGAHWSTALKVSSGSNPAASWDVIRAGGKWRVVYGQCGAGDCTTGTNLWYRDSTDGSTWSTAFKLSSTTRPWPSWASMAYTTGDGRTYVAWSAAATSSASQYDIYVRGGH